MYLEGHTSPMWLQSTKSLGFESSRWPCRPCLGSPFGIWIAFCIICAPYYLTSLPLPVEPEQARANTLWEAIFKTHGFWSQLGRRVWILVFCCLFFRNVPSKWKERRLVPHSPERLNSAVNEANPSVFPAVTAIFGQTNHSYPTVSSRHDLTVLFFRGCPALSPIYTQKSLQGKSGSPKACNRWPHAEKWLLQKSNTEGNSLYCLQTSSCSSRPSQKGHSWVFINGPYHQHLFMLLLLVW